MNNDAKIKPEWLEIIACCSPKVQMDLIRAIVAWQTDGTMPDFRGTKKALFLMMVHDITGTTPEAVTETAESKSEAADAPEGAPQEPEQTETPQPAASKPAPAFKKRKNPNRYFFPNGPLY